MNNLRQIGLALHNYEAEYGSLPPTYTVDADGNRLHSWRTLILPHLGEHELYEQIDLSKPWDHAVNADIAKTALNVYICPSADLQPGQTTYVALVDDESTLQPGIGRRLDEVTCPLGHAVLVIETIPENAISWMTPSDAAIEEFLAISPESVTAHTAIINVLMADGSVANLSTGSPESTRRALASIHESVPSESEW